MGDAILYLLTSFWLGAVHAATPGHGKTIAASYFVGARGRPVDAVVLGIFVTLSHTSGIVLVALLATAGSAWLIPQRAESYLAVATGVFVAMIGVWMLRTQLRLLPAMRPGRQIPQRAGTIDGHGHGHAHGKDHVHPHPHPHDHNHSHNHSHGWGIVHTHDIDAMIQTRPKLLVLLGWESPADCCRTRVR